MKFTMAEAQDTLAANLRTIRNTQNLTIQDVSLRMGWDGGMIGDYEECKFSPSLRILLRLSDALEVPFSQLIEGL